MGGNTREFIDRMKGTRPVKILTSELSGVQLRFMLALAIGRNPNIIGAEYGVGSRVLIEGERGYFRPDVDWSQLGALLDVYWRHSTSWLISHFGPNWRDNIDGTKGSIQIWFCRGIVGSHLGDEVECLQFDN